MRRLSRLAALVLLGAAGAIALAALGVYVLPIVALSMLWGLIMLTY